MTKKFIVKRGDSVRVQLSVERKESGKQITRKVGGVILTDDEDDLFVFKKQDIQIFDLGMKLNESGEYARIYIAPYIAPSLIEDTEQADFSGLTVHLRAFESLLLSDSPLSSTDGKSNRQLIPFAFQDAFVDLFSVIPGDADQYGLLPTQDILLGQDVSRPYIKSIYSDVAQVAAPDSNVNWNENLQSESGVAKVFDKTTKFGARSVLYYNDWYTHGSKITKTSDYASTAVSPPNIKNVNAIYLVPALLTTYLGVFAGFDNPGLTLLARFCLGGYQDYEIFPDAIGSFDDDNATSAVMRETMKQLVINSGMYDALVSHLTVDDISNIEPGSTIFIVRQEVAESINEMNEVTGHRLSAILRTKGQNYYVWFDWTVGSQEIDLMNVFGAHIPFQHGVVT